MQPGMNRQRIGLYAFIALLVLLPFVVIAVSIASDPRSRANPAAEPKEVVFSNLRDFSVTVSFVTDDAVVATASAYTQAGQVASSGVDARDSATSIPRKTHYITINNLSPATAYEFRITSEAKEYTSAVDWQATTLAVQSSPPAPEVPYFGKVTGGTVTEGLVYAIAGDAEGNSTVSSSYMESDSYTVAGANLLDAQGEKVDVEGKELLIHVTVPGVGRGQIQADGSEKQLEEVTVSTSGILFNPRVDLSGGTTPTPAPTATPDPNASPTPVPSTTPSPSEFTAAQELEITRVSNAATIAPFSSDAELLNASLPYEILVSNLSSTGFSVSWRTKQATLGYLEVRSNGQYVRFNDKRDSSASAAKQRYTHYVDVVDSSAVAGTKVEFLLVADGVRFGVDLASDSATMLTAYSTYQQSLTGTDLITTPPAFDYALLQRVATLVPPFRISLPSAPVTAPVPAAWQGNATAAITGANYTQELTAQAITNVDSERDVLITVRTTSPDSLWAAGIVAANQSFSLSLGTLLNSARTAYVNPAGESLEVRASGFLNQAATLSQNYSADTVAVALQNPLAIITPRTRSNLTTKTVVVAAPAATAVQVRTNGTAQTVSTAAGSSFSRLELGLIAGANTVAVNIGTSSSVQAQYFYLQADATVPPVVVLPETDIPLEVIWMLAGICLLTSGLVLNRRYYAGKY